MVFLLSVKGIRGESGSALSRSFSMESIVKRIDLHAPDNSLEGYYVKLLRYFQSIKSYFIQRYRGVGGKCPPGYIIPYTGTQAHFFHVSKESKQKIVITTPMLCRPQSHILHDSERGVSSHPLMLTHNEDWDRIPYISPLIESFG